MSCEHFEDLKLGRLLGPETLVNRKAERHNVVRPHGKAGEVRSHHRRKVGDYN